MNVRCLALPVAVLLVFSAEHALEQARGGDAQEAKALADKSGCLRCHSVDKKIVGPAFQDIAAKYKADADARETLNKKIKNGGKGNWTEVTGGVRMPPHSALLSEAEIAQLVDWVLKR